MATVPKQVAFSSSLSNPRMSLSPAISLPCCRKISAFPVFRSSRLIASPVRSLSSLDSRTRRVLRRVGHIGSDAQETSADVPTVTDSTWKSLVLEAEGPVLVEFWASWCGPCRIIHPLIDELAKDYAGKLKCFRLNTDDSPSTAKQYGVRSIPTTMIFINGEKKEAIIGALPKTTLASSIEKFLWEEKHGKALLMSLML